MGLEKKYIRNLGMSRKEFSGLLLLPSETATTRAVRNGTIFIPLRYHTKNDGSEFPDEIVVARIPGWGRK
jgi:hypothetical protein